MLKRLLIAVALLAAFAVPVRAAEVGFDFRGAVLASHYVQSGWNHPQFAISEVALGPHIGGLYVGGVGLRQIDGFGTVYPLLTYVGQGTIPKLSFLRGIVINVSMCNQGIFAGQPAYFFGIGVATK